MSVDINYIKGLIKRNDYNEINEFINKTKIEFKLYLTEEFNILDFVFNLRNELKISWQVKDLIIKNLDRSRQEIIKIVLKNDLQYLKNYCIENRISEFKKFTYLPYLDFERLVLNFNSKKQINSEIKDYVIFNYTKERGKVMEILFKNDENSVKELKQYLLENEIEIKDLIDKHFNLIKYCKYFNKIGFDNCFKIINKVFKEFELDIVELKDINNNYKLKKYIKDNFNKFKNLKNFDINKYLNSIKYITEEKINILWQYYDKRRCLIIDLIIKEDIFGLTDYIQINNGFELKDLNGSDFDIINYCKFSLKNVSEKLMNFLLINFDKRRKEVLDILEEVVDDNKKIENLKNYVEKSHGNFEFKNLSDKDFDFIRYCHSSNKISGKIENFIISHFNSVRYRLVELIQSDDNVEELESVEFDLNKLNDSNFDFIKYCQDNNNGISTLMKSIVEIKFDSNKNEIVNRIKNNDISYLKEYMEENNVELEKLNNKSFNIVKYTISLYKNKKISEEMKDFVISHLNIRRSNIIELIEFDDVETLENFLKEEKNFKLNDINDEYFNFKEYCEKYGIIKSNDMENLLQKCSDKEKYILNILEEKDHSNKLNKLKEYYFFFNDFEFKELNENIVKRIISLYEDKIINSDIKNFVLENYDFYIKNIIKFIYEDNRNKLLSFILKYWDKFKDLIDIYFVILKNLNIFNEVKISKKTIEYVLKYFDRRKEKIESLLKKGNRNELKKYINNYEINISELDDGNLIKNCNNNKMIDYLKSHYTPERSKVVEMIDNNKISELYSFFIKINKWPVDFNDKYFNIIEYCCTPSPYHYVTFEMCNFIINNYNKERSYVINNLKNSEFNLSDYANKDKFIINSKELNDDYFDFIKYLFSLPDDDNNYKYIKCYFFTYYSKEIYRFINVIKNYHIIEIKQYIKSENIEFNKINYKFIRIIKYICINLDGITPEIKRYILYLIDTNISKVLIRFIEKDDTIKMKQYLEEYEIETKQYLEDQEIEHCKINNTYNSFNIYKSCKDNNISISFKMNELVEMHYDENTYKIVNLINNNIISELKIFLKKENVELEQIKFHLIEYCDDPDNGISDEMKFFAISHWNKYLFGVMELIQSRSIYQLKRFMSFIEKDFSELNTNNFNIIQDYLIKYNDNIANYMTEYVISHENRYRGRIVDIIKSNNSDKIIISKLKDITKEYKRAFNIINDNNFDIIEFCKSNNISKKIIIFIKSHFTLLRYGIIEIIVNRSIPVEEALDYLKKYFEKHKMNGFESLDDDTFRIIEYCKNYSVRKELKNYIIKYYYKERGDIIKMIEEGNIDEFNKYVTDKNIEFEKLIDEHFNFYKCIDKMSIKEKLKIYFKDKVSCHYNNERWKLIEITEADNISEKEKINKIKKYMNKNKIDLKNHINEDFDIIKYILDNISELNELNKSSFKLFLISRIDKKIPKIEELLKDQSKSNSEKIIGIIHYFNNYIPQNDIINQYFDLLTYSIENEMSFEILKFTIDQYKTIYSCNENSFLFKPFFTAVYKNNFTVANLILESRIYYPNKDKRLIIKKLTNKNALSVRRIRFLLNNNYKLKYIIKTLKEEYNGNTINEDNLKRDIITFIVNNYIFDNKFILILLVASKNQISIKEKELKKMIKNETKKIDIEFWIEYAKKTKDYELKKSLKKIKKMIK